MALHMISDRLLCCCPHSACCPQLQHVSLVCSGHSTYNFLQLDTLEINSVMSSIKSYVGSGHACWGWVSAPRGRVCAAGGLRAMRGAEGSAAGRTGRPWCARPLLADGAP